MRVTGPDSGRVARDAEVGAALTAGFDAMVQPVLERALQVLAAGLLHVEIAIQIKLGAELETALPALVESMVLPMRRQIDARLHDVGITIVVVIPVEYRRREFRVGALFVPLLLAEFLERVARVVKRV